jgi:amidase
MLAMNDDVAGFDVSELQQRIDKRELLAEDVVGSLLKRIEAIDRSGPAIRSIIEVNPEAGDIARRLDGEPSRGPLHGIPILLKDNIDTADDMHTTAGSLALESSRPTSDAFVAKRLREAGAVLLGKANMSEWANFRSTHSSSGWSARGGQALNPYVLDRSPCGSSSGSASAVAAGLAPVSLGTETDGSILCPAAMCGVVGIKPTVGLTSRGGVIPISHTQDTVGPFARTVAGAALVLGAISGIDPGDPATARSAGKSYRDYTQFLDPGGLNGARIGIPRDQYFGYNPKVDAVVETAIDAMRRAGAVIVDPADIATAKQMKEGEMTVLLYEFKAGLNQYLRGRNGEGPRSLEEIVAFNVTHSDRELPFFGQELFLQAQEKADLTAPEYLDALAQDTRLAQAEGIDAVMNQHNLDALVMPTTGPAFTIDLVNGDHFSGGSSTPAAIAGYPAITIPAGDAYGLPVGITFMGRAFSEPVLIRLAYALEQLLQAWRPPRFLPTVDVSAAHNPA